MKVLLLGGGGREHALAWSLSKSPLCEHLYIAPGNPGTKPLGENIALDPEDFEQVKKFVLSKEIELVVVGPEQPLVKGIVDFFRDTPSLARIPVIGPDQKAADLEGSKQFAKDFMNRHDIPTGDYQVVEDGDLAKAKTILDQQKPPYVIKADGLAAGKGVSICNQKEEAVQVLEDFFVNEKLGGAGKKVVIEEFLDGEELSVFILTDGDQYLYLPDARDYKQVGDRDTGPNTGGMGAISPVPGISQLLLKDIDQQIVQPTLKGIKEDDLHFRGFLYFGLIIVDGDPYVLEYNVRLGDPEAEVILPRVNSDLLNHLQAIANNDLAKESLQISKQHAATVMMVSGGYPGAYEKGKPISGLEQVSGSWVFHAGTKEENGELVTSGGRVLSVTSLGDTLKDALNQSYDNIEKISFQNTHYRTDIGQ